MVTAAHGLFIVGTVIALAHYSGDVLATILLVVAWLALHGRLHWRFWHYLIRDLRRWLLRR